MNREIQDAVIGMLTVATSPDTETSGDDMHAVVSDLFKLNVPLPVGVPPQAVAQAVANTLREPIQDLIISFCAAFSSLAKINDAGQTEMTTAELLTDLALQWQTDDDA